MTLAAFFRRFGLLLVIALLIAAVTASGAWRWLSLAALQAHHAQLKLFVAANPGLSVVVFLAAFVVVVTSCLPGTSLMTTASGYLFGPVFGGLLSLAACVVGSSLVFLACRSAFADVVARHGGPRVRSLELALDRNAFSYLLTLKLMPVAPYFLPNVAAGLAGVRLLTVIGATALGSAPVCFILASLGAGLGRVLGRGAPPDLRLFERPDVMLPLLGLSLLSVLSIAWRVLKGRRPSLPGRAS